MEKFIWIKIMKERNNMNLVGRKFNNPRLDIDINVYE